MKLSTKSTYGLRAMVAIALNEAGAATSIAEISRKEEISVAYLEQLLNKLRRKGLVESIRGARGGYVLSRSASDITVADIVNTLEGSVYPVGCAATAKDAVSCSRGRSCAPKLVWHKLAKAISDCLESVTLEDLRAEAEKIDHRS